MAQKILGYIQLIWTCDHCGTQNPGAIKSCTSCGAPQPPDVQFEKVDLDTFDFIKDEALIRMAKSGPDKHCPYCGTRNLADAQTCVQCGSDITVGAKVRPSGEVIEDRGKPAQPAQPQRPSTGVIIALVLVVLVVCVMGGIFLSKMTQTDQISASVSAVEWERRVLLEAYQEVSDSDWASSIPQDASVSSCTQQYRYDSDTPKPNSVEVCGEPYTIDTGTGIGQVVQDCVYQVYEDYCSYTIMSWTVIDTLTTSGSDLTPAWPSASLTESQRFGSQEESYAIYFTSGDNTYTYTTSDSDLYSQAQRGSLWNLEVNQYGSVASAQPAQ